MKKILSCLLAVLLLASLTVSAFAASPEKPEDVAVVEATTPTEEEATSELTGVEDADKVDVTDVIVLTPDTDADKLPEASKDEYDAAKDALMDLDAVIADTEGLDALVDGRAVAVSAIFDISVKEGEEVNFPLTIKLKIPSPETFVALLQYNEDHFELVETELEDDILTFTVEHLCPFAIISLVD